MEIVKLRKIIKEKLDLSIKYGKNNSKIEPPFLIYLGAGSDNISADNKTYNSKNKYNLELYFREKDESLEMKIENLLNDNNIPWEKSEDIFISDENLFEIIYYI